MLTLFRGARPSPRHKLAAAIPHKITITAPPQFIRIPKQLSMWGNSQFGDCVVAEEAFAKACNPTELFVTEAEAVTWAKASGFLNGADLTDVMTAMQVSGFQWDANDLGDGPTYTSVDWTSAAVLENAIYTAPVKLGIAADQLQNIFPDTPVNGWFATGFTADSNEDHCTSLCGFGPMSWLASELSGTVPSGVDGTKPGYAMFSWSSIGVIDVPSLLAICGEAWLRNYTTVIQPLRK